MRLQPIEQSGAVWRVRLEPQQPGGDVVVSATGLAALRRLVEAVDADSDCRVLVLEGADGVFCRGMDLSGRRASDVDPLADMEQFAEAVLALFRCRAATIAAVDGACLAGGTAIMAACDRIIATERAVFGLPEAMLNLLPSMVLPLLLQRMPPAQLRWLAMSPDSIDADTAAACGLVDELCATEDLEKTLRRRIKSLLRASPQAIAALKQHLERLTLLSVEDGVRQGAALTAERLRLPQTAAGIAAFLDGEPSPWLARYRPARDRGAARND